MNASNKETGGKDAQSQVPLPRGGGEREGDAGVDLSTRRTINKENRMCTIHQGQSIHLVLQPPSGLDLVVNQMWGTNTIVCVPLTDIIILFFNSHR